MLAEYQTPKNELNQVILWDRIVETEEQAKLDERNIYVKYALVDQAHALRVVEAHARFARETCPGKFALHVCSAFFALSGQDLPDGNYAELESSGAKQKSKGGVAVKTGASNVNAWILTVTYGMCFGVELTMNNKVVMYFFNYYGLSPQIAGLLGSCFGLMNLFARSWGGLLSDAMAKRFG